MFRSFKVTQGQTSNFSIDLKVSTGKLLSSSVSGAAVSIKGVAGVESLSSSLKNLFTAKGVITPTNGFISKSKTMSVSSSIADSGTTSEVTTYNISGAIPMFGQQQKIAQIIVTAKSDEAFVAPPSAKVSKNTSTAIVQGDASLMLKKISTTKDSSSNITSCTLDVYLSSNTDLAGTGTFPTYELVLPLKNRITKSLFIDRVTVSPLEDINVNGETKNIKIIGIPETPFVYTAYDVDDNTIIQTTFNQNIGFLNGPTIKDGDFFENRNKDFNSNNQTTIDKNGVTVRAISDVLPTNGVFKINQVFPKTKEIIQTAINGSMAVSGTNKIIFDSLTNVQVGDQIIMKEISGTSTVKVLELNPDGDEVNECLLSGSVTAADDAVARFIRGTKYYINVSSTSGLSDNVPSSDPTITLNQYLNPQLNLKFTDTTRFFSINGQTVPASGDQSFYLSFSGKPNKNLTELEDENLFQKVNQVTITLDGVGSKAFSITKTPVYSTSENLSDFSNTSESNESGTEFEINNIAVALSNSETTNGICTITFNLIITKWGNSDLTSTLNLNNIISAS
jgi:hypothetical protein